MQIKDHYKTLGIAPQATQQEIKAAYRRLVHRYHPDKNTGDRYTTHYFHEIHEAYEVLSHPRLRTAYDKERSLSGYTRGPDSRAVTPTYIYNECLKLTQRVYTTDTYRISQTTVYEYSLLLLSDTHLAILHREADPELNRQIVRIMLQVLKRMEYFYFKDIHERLLALAGSDEDLLFQLNRELQRKVMEMRWQRIKPWVILLTALLLCIFMFQYIR